MHESSNEIQTFSPHLKKVLNSYRAAAMTSLSGPDNYLAQLKTNVSSIEKSKRKHKPTHRTHDPIPQRHYPIQKFPILTAPDQSQSERSETFLEGEMISCFDVGGEKRLCLPQILNTVLRDFSLQQINSVCDDLHIFCSRCNREQLETLKMTAVLPITAPSCGLITKTDAERLSNALLHRHPVLFDGSKRTKTSFIVFHECFGKCKGLFTPDDYTSPNDLCVECIECRGHFSPNKFVRHAHKGLEKRTCHWGFDSANWRAYVLLARDQPNLAELRILLDEMKNKFTEESIHKFEKKKFDDAEELRSTAKKAKHTLDESCTVIPIHLFHGTDLMSTFWYPTIASQWTQTSLTWPPVAVKDGKSTMTQSAFFKNNNFHSLHPFLNRGPPVLLNPERVVSRSEINRYEQHHQPNVALAPSSAQQVHRVMFPLHSANVSVSESSLVGDKIINSITNQKSEDAEQSNDNEMEILRKIITENNVGAKPLKKIIKQVEKLQMKYKKKVEAALNEKKALQQELEFFKFLNNECSEKQVANLEESATRESRTR